MNNKAEKFFSPNSFFENVLWNTSFIVGWQTCLVRETKIFNSIIQMSEI